MAETKVLIDNKAVPVSETRTVISLNQPTPQWVTWVFRIQFVLNKALMMYLTADNGLTAAEIKKWVLILTLIDFSIWGLGRFVGLKKTDFEEK